MPRGWRYRTGAPIYQSTNPRGMSTRDFAASLGTGYPRGNTQRATGHFPVASIGAAAGGSGPGGSWSLPWAALPLAIHRLLNGGKSGIVDVSEQAFAVFLYETDRLVRVCMWAVGALIAAYVAAVGFPDSLNTDFFTWVVLGCTYVGMALSILSALWGRFTFTSDFTVEELAARSELRLPWLLLNYQSFGIDRVEGAYAAAIVILTHVIGGATWGLALYVTATRMFYQDPNWWIYTAIWVTFTATAILDALSSSVSFADARDVTSKSSGELSTNEAVRVSLIQLKVFWVLTVCLPLLVTYVLYANDAP